MERKINELNNLIEKLNERVKLLNNNQAVSSIERDIILDLLRQTYIKVEKLLEVEKEAPIAKNEVAQVKQVIQGSSGHAHAELKSETQIIDQPGQERVIHKVEQQQKETDYNQANLQTSESVKPFDQKVEQPVETAPNEVIVPKPVSMEEVPVMTFPKVEIQAEREKEEEKTIPVQNESLNTYTPIEQPAYKSEEPVIENPVYSPPPQGITPTITQQNNPVAPVSPVSEISPSLQERRTERVTPTPQAKSFNADLFGTTTIADKLKNEKPSLSDRIAQGREDHSLAQKIQLKPISDLKTAIGINEKFQFVNDLFLGRTDLYNEAIHKINICGSAFTAEGIFEDLSRTHNWDQKSEAYNKLKNFIKRRYM